MSAQGNHFEAAVSAPMAGSGQKRSYSTAEFTVETALQGPENLRYDHTPEEMETLTKGILARGSQVVDDLVSIEKKDRTYANSVLPLAMFESDFSTLSTNIRFYRYVSPVKEQAEKSIALEEDLDAFSIKLYMRVDFFEALKEYREQAKETKEWEKLGDEERRYVDKMIHSMERSGLDKPKEVRD